MIEMDWCTQLVMVTVVASVQVMILGLCARLFAKRIALVDSVSIHRIWLVVIIASLAIIPIHFGGYRSEIAIPRSSIDRLASSDTLGADLPSRTNSFAGDDDVDRELTLVPVCNSVSRTPPPQPISQPANERFNQSDSRFTIRRFATSINGWCPLAIALLVGLSVSLIRMVGSYSALSRSARSGVTPSKSTLLLAQQLAEAVGLRKQPRIKVSRHVEVPLVFGMGRPTILLPDGFDHWQHDEQVTTLLHELFHIRRSDPLIQFIAELTKAIYWFHPVQRIVNRKLVESRECSTDQQAGRWLSCQSQWISPDRYAECLLTIVSRLGRAHRPPTCAIAMSRHGNLERRLRLITDPNPQPLMHRSCRSYSVLACLVVIALITTVEVKFSVAEPPVDQGAKTSDQSDSAIYTPTHDLIESAQQSVPYRGDAVRKVPISIKGRAVNATGAPVQEAMVILREQNSARTQRSLDSRRPWHEQTVNAVVAKVKTDASGHFHFDKAAIPITESPPNVVRLSVVVITTNEQVGWQTVDWKPSEPVKSELEISVVPTSSVSLRLVADGKPIKNASALVTSVGLADGAGPERLFDVLRFNANRFGVRTKSDDDGIIHFEGIPTGTHVTVYVAHPDYAPESYTVACGEDVPVGPNRFRHLPISDAVVLKNHGEAVADRGFLISGRVVDPKGEPIPSVVIPRYHRQTDADGRFQFRISKSYRERRQRSRRGGLHLEIQPEKNSGLIPETYIHPVDVETIEQPIKIRLQSGQIIRGRTIDESGAPIEGIVVSTIDRRFRCSAVSDQQGKFEFVCPEGDQLIVFTTRKPGFAIPGLFGFHHVSIEEARKSLHRELFVSESVSLGDIVIPPRPKWRIQIRMPNGSPAGGASLVVYGQRPSNIRQPVKSVLTSPVVADGQGRIEIPVPTEIASERHAELRLIQNNRGYTGRLSLPENSADEMEVVLEPGVIVRGTVLFDGAPVENAVIQVSQLEQRTMQRGAAIATYSLTTYATTVKTDRMGNYRAVVPRGSRASVSFVSSHLDVSPTVGASVSESEDGFLQASPINLISGDGEIAGQVVDAKGNPISGLNVRVKREGQTKPSWWVGHQSKSQSVTDSKGRFHLRAVPEGNYQLDISTPYERGKQTRRTMVKASTGEMDVEAKMTETLGTILSK